MASDHISYRMLPFFIFYPRVTRQGLILGTEIFGGLGSRIGSCEETR